MYEFVDLSGFLSKTAVGLCQQSYTQKNPHTSTPFSVHKPVDDVDKWCEALKIQAFLLWIKIYLFFTFSSYN